MKCKMLVYTTLYFSLISASVTYAYAGDPIGSFLRGMEGMDEQFDRKRQREQRDLEEARQQELLWERRRRENQS